jgi:hypothetical protein
VRRSRLVRHARAKRAELESVRRDPRFVRVIGKLVAMGLLETNLPIRPSRAKIHLEDALWAATVEPRVAELLPALVIKRPSVFLSYRELPGELREITRALRRGHPTQPFLGIAPERYARWLPRVGHRGKLPTVRKNFRLTREDLERIDALRRRIGLRSEVAVIRRGLDALWLLSLERSLIVR